LYWDPSHGLQIENGNILSPAIILEHEFDHSISRSANTMEHCKSK